MPNRPSLWLMLRAILAGLVAVAFSFLVELGCMLMALLAWCIVTVISFIPAIVLVLFLFFIFYCLSLI